MSPIVFMVQRRRLNFTNLFFYALLKSSNFTKIKYKLEVQGPMSNVLHNTTPRKLHKKLSIIDSFYYISMIITFTPPFCYLTFFRFFFFSRYCSISTRLLSHSYCWAFWIICPLLSHWCSRYNSHRDSCTLVYCILKQGTEFVHSLKQIFCYTSFDLWIL